MTNERLVDIGVAVAILVISVLYIRSLGPEAAALAEKIEQRRTTIQTLTDQRSRLSQRDDMTPLTRVWDQSKQIIERCGLDRTVFADNDDRETLYGGSGRYWTAQVKGDAVPVLSCANQLADLDQIVFEQVSVKGDQGTATATIAFSVYGRLRADDSES